MAKFVAGDRVRLVRHSPLRSDNRVPIGTTGTVLQESFVPFVEWDDFSSGHDATFRDGRTSCWAVCDSRLEAT